MRQLESNPPTRVKYSGTIYIKEFKWGFNSSKVEVRVERDFYMQTRGQLKCTIENMASLHQLAGKRQIFISVIFD